MTENDIAELLEKGEKPFRQYVGICASGQSVKTTLIRLYSVLLQEAFILSEDPKYQNYVDPYYTLVGYFNSIRELGGAVRLLDDDINSRLLEFHLIKLLKYWKSWRSHLIHPKRDRAAMMWLLLQI